MVEFVTWFLNFVKNMVLMIFAFVSPDGHSFGYTLLGIAVVGAIISATVGAVAIVANMRPRRHGGD